MFRLFFFIFFIASFYTTSIVAQHDYFHQHHFTKADSLRGQLRPERTCYDVQFYELDIEVDVEEKFISGTVRMHFKVLEDTKRIQIDLFENMKIKQIYTPFSNNQFKFERVHNAVFIETPLFKKGTQQVLNIVYEGKPIAAKNAPWDGGFVWKKDNNGSPWIGVACEGTGASLWWPNKDHLSDEPDSMSIKITIPDPLVCVSNGNLRQKKSIGNGTTRYDWFVSYPINNYNVTLNIGNYTHFSDTYTAADGDTLPLDYYVLPHNLEKAKKQFQQVPGMLACYETIFGKYPFWEDGYALVETPYLGMEHQGAIAYGNQYKRGYMGGMIPADMDWDYIIIHETGHEYWGNSISCHDHAEMWIHESFTTYMEALYVECKYSTEDAIRYLKSQRLFIADEAPIVGPLDVNFDAFSSSDHYYKGAWMLHTLRNAIADEVLFFDILKSFYQEHQLSHIHSEDFFNYVNTKTGQNWDAFFQQYLYHPKPPTLLYRAKQKGKNVQLSCRWEADVKDFEMPFLVRQGDQYQIIYPSSERKKDFVLKNVSLADIELMTDLFYVNVKDL